MIHQTIHFSHSVNNIGSISMKPQKLRSEALTQRLCRTAILSGLVAVVFLSAASAQDDGIKTEKPIIDIYRGSPDAIPLDPRDPTRDVSKLFRDPNDNPKREPGPINIQKTPGGFYYQGIPTFFRAPVALGPEDLKAGKVEVAIMGASFDMSTSMRGTAWGPQAVRTGEVGASAWGELITLAHPSVGDIDFMQELTVVDYGDAPIDPFSTERSIISVHKMVKEIAETGAIPVIVGGDHSLMYPDVVAITDVYGKGNVGVIHFDAHFDGIPLMFGHYITHGAPVRRLIDEGHVKGKNFVQIGLNSSKPGGKDVKWMRQNQVRYHMMAEIEKKGWEVVMKQALAEALDGPEYIFITVDTDVLDPAWAPGMGTPEPGGLSIRELFPMLRAVGVQNKVVGIDMVEVNPLTDPTYRSKLVAVRILRELLTGIAMQKRGITDPSYLDAQWIDHGVPLGE
jgi:agmatinase